MKILVVDDNVSLARGLKSFLEEEKHQCLTAATVNQGLKLLEENSFDLVITDLKLPDGDGLKIITAARSAEASLLPEVILMTAFGTVETAVEAIRLGAMDYLTKPVSLEEFSFRINKVAEIRDLERKNLNLQRQQRELIHLAGLDSSLEDIAGNSNAISEVKQLIAKVAPYPSTVLITGETGVGKELVAKAVHNLSERKTGPFVRLNCASIPETLFEAELFGHEKGAFTDARQSRSGCFENAEGGTLFLDEIGEVPLNLQAKLLRVLQEKEVTRLGSSRVRKIDVRIVAATNRNLDEMCGLGKFREDLLYRLSVFKIQIPPLRERKEDIPLICEKLLARLAQELNRPSLQLSSAALHELTQLAWPGNIRELRNLLERAAVMADGDMLENADLGLRTQSVSSPLPPPANARKIAADVGLIQALEELEKQMILTALQNNDNVKSRAADELKIPRTQLLYRMKRLGLED